MSDLEKEGSLRAASIAHRCENTHDRVMLEEALHYLQLGKVPSIFGFLMKHRAY